MDMISKKELLQQTGISYGQLYRWKRERLIPEEWFIKKSSFTGQETMFPKEQIMTRIAFIQNSKGQHSLEELADLLDPQKGVYVSPDELSQRFPIDSYLAQKAQSLLVETETTKTYEAASVAFLLALDGLKSHFASSKDFEKCIDGAVQAAENTSLTDKTLVLLSVAKTQFVMIAASGASLPDFDSRVVILDTISLGEVLQTRVIAPPNVSA